jgi:hypothetical protein
MSKRKTAKKRGASRRVAGRPVKGARREQPAVCPESLHPVVAVIGERVDALKRLHDNPGVTPGGSRELGRVIKVLEQCKARLMLACAKGSPPYYMPF